MWKMTLILWPFVFRWSTGQSVVLTAALCASKGNVYGQAATASLAPSSSSTSVVYAEATAQDASAWWATSPRRGEKKDLNCALSYVFISRGQSCTYRHLNMRTGGESRFSDGKFAHAGFRGLLNIFFSSVISWLLQYDEMIMLHSPHVNTVHM